MSVNYNSPVGMGQGKAATLLQSLQNKRQKMEHITRQQSVPISAPPTSSLVPTRSQLTTSFTNNPQPAPKPKPIKGLQPPEDKPNRLQMNEAINVAERTSSGYYIGNPSLFGNLLIPVIPRLEAPKDREFKETRLPRDQ